MKSRHGQEVEVLQETPENTMYENIYATKKLKKSWIKRDNHTQKERTVISWRDYS